MPRPIYEVKAQFFKTLGHPARIRILEVLSEGESSVSAMQPEVGIELSHLSQQLAVLRKAGVVEAERQGANMIYRVIDPQTFELLRVAKSIIVESLSQTEGMLAELDDMKYGSDSATGS